jgi:hypothetical protein
VIVSLGWHGCPLRQGQVPARFQQLFCIPSRLFLQQSSLWWSSLRQLPGSGRKPRVRIWRGKGLCSHPWAEATDATINTASTQGH